MYNEPVYDAFDIKLSMKLMRLLKNPSLLMLIVAEVSVTSSSLI